MSKAYIWQEQTGRERYQHPLWMGPRDSEAGRLMDLAWEQRDPTRDADVLQKWLESLPSGHWMLDSSSRGDVEELFHDALEKMRWGA